MGIKKNIVVVGNSKGITIPKAWFDLIEQRTGKKPKIVEMEINTVLIVKPLLE